MRNPDRETTFRFRLFSVENRRSAMKVGTDGVLLGAWAELPAAIASPAVLDIGAGTGLVSLMLAQRFPGALIEAMEIDPASAEECAANFRNSPWSDRLAVREADFLTAAFDRKFDLIVSNPPFFNNGAKAPDSARMAARHEDSLPLGSLINRAAELLAAGGSIALIVPADRRADAEYAAELARLTLWRKVTITTVVGKPPRRVLLQFVNTPTIQNLKQAAAEETLNTSEGERTPWHRELVKDFYIK